MKTVYTTFPIFNNTNKQDVNRLNGYACLYSPTHQLPPFEFQHDTQITRIDLVDCDSSETEITNHFFGGQIITAFTNDSYDSISFVVGQISQPVGVDPAYSNALFVSKVVSTGVAFAYSNTISVATGDVIGIDLYYTEALAIAPEVVLVDSGGSDISDVFTLVADTRQTLVLISEATDAAAVIRVRTGAGLGQSTIFFYSASQDTVLPALAGLATDYITYMGGSLNYLLEKGEYHLKLTDYNDDLFYSDKFIVEDVYPNLISSWTNDGSFPYETFTSSGVVIDRAINTSGDGICSSDAFETVNGEEIAIMFNLILNSGTLPYVFITNSDWTEGVSILGEEGINIITLTSSWTGVTIVRFYNDSTNANFATSNVFVIRSYSEKYTKLSFTNDKDLPTPINEPTYYCSGGFTDTIWFKAPLNTPEHETTIIGNEKDGVLIAEKLVSKYSYKVISYLGRNVYRALHRLPLFDDIIVIDEVGNEYDFAHTAQVDPMEWNYFDTGKLTIKFNDGASVYQGNLDNLT